MPGQIVPSVRRLFLWAQLASRFFLRSIGSDSASITKHDSCRVCRAFLSPRCKYCPGCGAAIQGSLLRWIRRIAPSACVLIVFAGLSYLCLISLKRAGHWESHSRELEMRNQSASSKLERLLSEPEAVRLHRELNEVNEKLVGTERRMSGLQEAQSQLASLQSERDELTSKLRQALINLDDLRAELATSKMERDRAQANLAEFKNRLRDQRDKLAAGRSGRSRGDELSDTASQEIGGQRTSKSNNSASWEKLNGWLGAGRAISKQEVLDTLGNPSRVKSNYGGRPAMSWYYELPNNKQGAVYFAPGKSGDHVEHIDTPRLEK